MNSVETFLPSAPRLPSSPDRARRPRVLLVEDEPGIRTAMSSLLVEEGFDVKTADGGRSALRYLSQVPGALPDVVVLDLRMPDMDGWQFRCEQRKDNRLAAIPVLAVSADQTPQARAVDAAGFLSKPFALDDLVEALRRILSTTEAVPRSELTSATRLAAGIAHEISSPLCCVMGNLDLAVAGLGRLPGEPAAELRGFLEGALAGTERIDTILSELRWARSTTENGGGTDAVGVVRLVLRMMASEIRRRANLETFYEVVPRVGIPRAHLERVMTNLVGNACIAMDGGRFSESGMRVQVTAGAGGHVEIRVADSGRGIPAAIGQEVFEPFFTTRRAGEGTGLGLAICRALVRDAGGEISFRSLDRGTEFLVSLPARIREPGLPQTP